MCGGTGLYLSSILEDYDMADSPEDSDLRSELETLSMDELKTRLEMHRVPHNTTDTEERERLTRAIEVEESSQGSSITLPTFKSCAIGIDLPREEIHRRIETRLKQRLQNGMLEEVEMLLTQTTQAVLENYGLEYRYLSQHVSGELRYNDMYQKLLSAIRKFAKRQMTWFRRMERNGVTITWIDGMAEPSRQLEEILLARQTL